MTESGQVSWSTGIIGTDELLRLRLMNKQQR